MLHIFSLLLLTWMVKSCLGRDADVCGWNPHTVDALENQFCPPPNYIHHHVNPELPSSWTPWTHKPYCVGSGGDLVCVFTNAMLPQGLNQGISIITTPSAAAREMNILGHQLSVPYHHADPSRVFDKSPYEIREVAGKGKGAFATTRIPRGRIVMIDHPVMLSPTDEVFNFSWHNVSAEEARQLFKIACEQLPDPDKLLSLAKSDFYGDISPIQNVIETNSYTVLVHKQHYNALFLEVSRINHACNPNVRGDWSQQHLAFIIWSLRDIEPGEEVTMTYIPLGSKWTWQKRQDELSAGWHFKCKCSLCSAPREDIEASDKRRMRFGSLAKIFQRREEAGNYNGAIDVVNRMLEINNQEPMLTSPVQLYLAAARVAQSAGDVRLAMYIERVENEMQARGFPLKDSEIEETKGLKHSFLRYM